MRRGHQSRAATDVERERAHTHGGPAVPKIVGILVALVIVRVLLKVGKRTAGSAEWRERRHEAIATLHRQLHAEDAPGPA